MLLMSSPKKRTSNLEPSTPSLPGRSRRCRTSDLRALVAGLRGEVRFDEPLSEWTSFRIGGPADVLVLPADIDDIRRLVKAARAARVSIFVLGGTNVLVRDGGIRGIVVSLAKLTAIRDEGRAVLYAEGGVGMPSLIKFAITRSLTGLEWSAGIPGTVAGCAVMNAGTKLGEMKNVLKAVQMIGPDGSTIEVPASSIRFEYRHALLPPGIVVGVWVQLARGARGKIESIVKDYLRYRRSTQPLALPNAGCVFKNPLPETAGHLIESAGLKGASIGDAQVSEKHANFIVNRGQAQAADVLALIQQIRRTVRRRTGIGLELELTVVGASAKREA
jgi:UDP-N-acetylmuramate dehydrogenase